MILCKESHNTSIMKKVKLGKSDLMVTPVTFGAWAIGGWMWGGADKDDAKDALEASVDIGITTIDTAPIYGFGRSEEIVGKAIAGKRDKVELLTKFGMSWDTSEGEFFFDSFDNSGKPVKIHRYASPQSIIKECELSLKRLGTDYIDLYQIHWSDPTTPIEETMEAVQRLIKQGKIRAAGVSNYSREQSIIAADNILLASNQVPYSMLKRDIEEELLPWSIENEVSILAYSPLQRGILTGKITPEYTFSEGDNRSDSPYFSKENIVRANEFLKEIQVIASEKSVTLGQLVIAWTIAQAGISVALVGARNRKQVEENAVAGNIDLTKEEIDTITNHLNQLKLVL